MMDVISLLPKEVYSYLLTDTKVAVPRGRRIRATKSCFHMKTSPSLMIAKICENRMVKMQEPAKRLMSANGKQAN